MTDEYIYEYKDDYISNRIKYSTLRDVLFLDSFTYPLIKLSFSDQSSVVYALEHSKIMHFLSELNANVTKLRTVELMKKTSQVVPGVLFLQSTDIPRNLIIRGRNELPQVNKDYYMAMVKGLYDNNSTEEQFTTNMHRVLVNYTPGLSNPKFQLKLFYLLCAKVVQMYKKLRENDVKKFFQGKLANFKKTSEILFPVQSKKTVSAITPTIGDKRETIKEKEEVQSNNNTQKEVPPNKSEGEKKTPQDKERDPDFFK